MAGNHLCLRIGQPQHHGCHQLNAQGYKVSNMKGGMMRWLQAGLAVKTGMRK
jgi:hypothetical protein